MTGRARESLFAIIEARIPLANVLDLYAGSGSLGLESLSRGASTAVFVEHNSAAADVIRRNIASVGLGGHVIQRPALSALRALSQEFDIIFIDPPYADGDASVRDTITACEPMLAQAGIIVVHRQANSEILLPDFLTSTDVRRYGDAVIAMIERTDR
jgi:16S rRNA (guanine(966)-N(2))-methyltransferase RsmD